MHRKFLPAAAAVLLCGCTAALTLSACEQKQVELDDVRISNYTMPEPGEEIAVLTVRDYGDIKIRLFPEETPTGAENFKLLVQSGFYDELIFHRVMDGFMIQGGDPRGDGTGGADAWGSADGFAQTISSSLCHVPGAVAYAIGSDKMNKSQFFIVSGGSVTDESFQLLAEQFGRQYPKAVKDLYLQVGGYPFLDNDYEIFGQVFDGLEHVLEIQTVPTDSRDKPKSQVVIEKAEIVPYDGSAPNWLTWNGEPVPDAAKAAE